MNSSLSVTAIVTDEVTAVEIHGVGVDGYLDVDRKATGWAKKHPRDQVDPEIAYNLAMSRALFQLAAEYGNNAAVIAGFSVDIAEIEDIDENRDAVVIRAYPYETADEVISDEIREY